MHNQTHQSDDRQAVRKPRVEPAGPQQTGLQTVSPANAGAISRLPGRGASQLRRSAVTQMQRTQGNAFVQRFLSNEGDGMQRVGLPNSGNQRSQSNIPTTNPPASGGNSGQGQAPAPAANPTSIGDGSATLTAAGGIISGQAGMVDINTPMFQVPGVLKASTLIVDNVIASSYTPGAGNVW